MVITATGSQADAIQVSVAYPNSTHVIFNIFSWQKQNHHCNYINNVLTLHKGLDILQINDVYKASVLKFVFLCVNDTLLSIFYQYYKRRRDQHSRSLRDLHNHGLSNLMFHWWSNLICPSDKVSWQPGCPILNINIQGNFCISQGNGSSDNLPENLVQTPVLGPWYIL